MITNVHKGIIKSLRRKARRVLDALEVGETGVLHLSLY